MSPTQTDRDRRPLRLLFVCSGNTCRSPLAEVIARRLAEDLDMESPEIRSAGTHASPGFPASEGARNAAARHGLSLSQHRSRVLTEAEVEWADLVLVMGPGHLRVVENLGGEGKADLLGSFAQGSPAAEAGEAWGIPDPFGGNEHVYEATFLAIERYLKMVLKRLAERSGP